MHNNKGRDGPTPKAWSQVSLPVPDTGGGGRLPRANNNIHVTVPEGGGKET